MLIYGFDFQKIKGVRAFLSIFFSVFLLILCVKNIVKIFNFLLVSVVSDEQMNSVFPFYELGFGFYVRGLLHSFYVNVSYLLLFSLLFTLIQVFWIGVCKIKFKVMIIQNGFINFLLKDFVDWFILAIKVNFLSLILAVLIHLIVSVNYEILINHYLINLFHLN